MRGQDIECQTEMKAYKEKQEDEFLKVALQEAATGLKEGGIPIGSVIVCDGKIIGRGHNRRVQKNSAILHAEMDALENAGRLPALVYKRCTLYTTLSPCSMCSGAILLYGIAHIVIGENKTFMGQKEKIFFAESVRKLNDLREMRRLRILDSRAGVHPVLWFILVVGAITTIGFAFFFGMDKFINHAIMVSALSVLIALILLTIISFEFPFTGDVRVDPETFQQAIGHY